MEDSLFLTVLCAHTTTTTTATAAAAAAAAGGGPGADPEVPRELCVAVGPHRAVAVETDSP